MRNTLISILGCMAVGLASCSGGSAAGDGPTALTPIEQQNAGTWQLVQVDGNPVPYSVPGGCTTVYTGGSLSLSTNAQGKQYSIQVQNTVTCPPTPGAPGSGSVTHNNASGLGKWAISSANVLTLTQEGNRDAINFSGGVAQASISGSQVTISARLSGDGTGPFRQLNFVRQ